MRLFVPTPFKIDILPVEFGVATSRTTKQFCDRNPDYSALNGSCNRDPN